MLNNIFFIFEQLLVYLPLMCGAYCSLALMKVPDLAIESAYVFGAIVGSKALFLFSDQSFISLFTILLAAMIGGMLVGLVSSVFTQFGKLPHLLSSLITMGLFHGINQFVLASSHIPLPTENSPLLLLPLVDKYPVIYLLSVLGLLIYGLFFFFMKTELGVSLAVYGNNRQFFDNYNISTRCIFICGIVISNALAGLSGYYVAQTNGFVDIYMGVGIALMSITVLILSKLINSKKPIFAYAPIIGLIFYLVLQQILLKIGFDLKYFAAAQAFIVLILMLIQFRKSRLFSDQLGL